MNTYFVAGHAKLPAGMAAQTIYETPVSYTHLTLPTKA